MCWPYAGASLVSWDCFVYKRWCVCVPLKALITIGMICCDIDCVWLVKQVVWLFSLFICFIWHLPSIKWIGTALVICISWMAAKKTKVMTYYLQKECPTVATGQNASVIKVSWQMRSDAFKRRLAFNFTIQPSLRLLYINYSNIIINGSSSLTYGCLVFR